MLNFLLDGTISKDDFNEKKAELDTELSKLYDERKRLQSTQDDEKKLKRQLQECREALETNPILKEFDRRVFEAVIDHVVIGERQEYDIIDPYKIKFIYKAGINFPPEGESNTYSYTKVDTCGDNSINIKEITINIETRTYVCYNMDIA